MMKRLGLHDHLTHPQKETISAGPTEEYNLGSYDNDDCWPEYDLVGTLGRAADWRVCMCNPSIMQLLDLDSASECKASLTIAKLPIDRYEMGTLESWAMSTEMYLRVCT